MPMRTLLLLHHFVTFLWGYLSLEVDKGDKTNASLLRAFLAAVTNEMIALARAGALRATDLCVENADHASG
ncbi:hypothetical protein SNOG_15701 [Parastagonospora nodorum SN15]|uniref:Uncharacterized protein n=1 Tax=Phaeosphaeria nodorum (strain SN15 / ATCC MYA-4574 / FGSC 10173) TaxID=321614 RepID=Q0TXE2_PHANO|nr:hypothetical protein SNOG_15701 [Parastagonospora nodorum SN15]EAT76796.1 hypothetical protein SNOG_15701 [Parastagonospora nodorum SN15]